MSGLVITLHIIVSLLLIGGILLQPGAKGGGLGSSFGGGGANSAFGAQGSAPVLAKVTYYLAAAFMLTSLVIEIMIVRENRSVFEKGGLKPSTSTPAQTPVVPPAPAPAPAAPAQK